MTRILYHFNFDKTTNIKGAFNTTLGVLGTKKFTFLIHLSVLGHFWGRKESIKPALLKVVRYSLWYQINIKQSNKIYFLKRFCPTRKYFNLWLLLFETIHYLPISSPLPFSVLPFS